MHDWGTDASECNRAATRTVFSAAWRSDSDEDVRDNRFAISHTWHSRSHEDTAVTEAQGSILKSHKGA